MHTAVVPLKAPFPYFGGKSKVARTVWERLGDVSNYCEPFFGSGAVLLSRPHSPRMETVNDLSAYIANFWRAVQADPEAVAYYADWPVNESDLHARHRWLVFSEDARTALSQVRQSAEYFDAKIAGWWCWGACCWIGGGWCPEQLPRIAHDGCGVNKIDNKRLHLGGRRGVNKIPDQRPHIGNGGRGVNSNNAAETCRERREWIMDWMSRLSDRLRSVRVCCGHWSRICDSTTTMTGLGLTGVFLDPPYRKTVNGEPNRNGNLYSTDRHNDTDALCDEVQEWCLKWGDDPNVRVVLCGYEGEYPKLDHAGWDCVPWKAHGGYGNQGRKNKNAARERLWCSPHCCSPMRDSTLF